MHNYTTRNYLKVVLITLCIVITAYIFYWVIFPVDEWSKSSSLIVFLMNWMGIFIAIYIIISWAKLTGTLFSLYTIFMLFFFLFNYGQSIMWAVGIHVPNEEIGSQPIYAGLKVPSNADIINGQIVTCISVLMFHLGAIVSYKPKRINLKEIKKNDHLVDSKLTLKAIFVTSVIIGTFVIPITLYDTFNSLKVSLSAGYKALYYSDYALNKSNFNIIINMFFFPSLVGLLIGSQFNRKITSIVYLTFTLYLVLNLLAGDRGSWVYKIVILIWLSHVCYKSINIKKFMKYFIISFSALYIVEAIVSLRNRGLANITGSQISDAFSFENSPLISTIFEMGGSMSVVIVLLMYGWDIWPYANTYFLGVMGMVSNQVIYAFEIPFSLISSWFSQEYLGLSYGAGFSIVAEAVLNFGPYFAPLIMIGLGYLIASIIYTDNRVKYSVRPLRFFFAVSTLHVFLPVTRGYFQILLKDWFYGVILYIFIILIVKNLFLKTTNKYHLKSQTK